MGRWMSPDWSASVAPVPYADLSNPQSLNLYAYLGNNPVMGVDPDGHMSAAMDGWGMDFNGVDGGLGRYFDEGGYCSGEYCENGGFYYESGPPSEQDAAQNNSGPRVYPPDFIGPLRAGDLKGPYVADLSNPEIKAVLEGKKKDLVIGDGECVTATKHFAGLENILTSQWREGPPVSSNPKPGTAIATFDTNGRYPKGGERNSGLYLRSGPNGRTKILDQYNHPPKPVGPRWLSFESPLGRSNESSGYFGSM